MALSLAVKKLLAENKLVENPILKPVAAASVGIVNGVPLLDLCYTEDVAATVTRLLVDLLAEAARQYGLAELVLSGGGSANQTTLRWLRAAVPGVRVLTTAELGVPAQAKEAVAFAVLGFLT